MVSERLGTFLWNHPPGVRVRHFHERRHHITHLSLCSGIGGIDIAAERHGFRTIQFVEREPFCQKILAKHFPDIPIHDNLLTFDATPYRGRVDLISAGFPCQPHSLAGVRKGHGDERDLWGEVARIVGEARPTWFVGENVPGLLTSKGADGNKGQFFGGILRDLAQMGYSVSWGVWRASDVRAVHRRARVFIVAYSPGVRCEGLRKEESEGHLHEEREVRRSVESQGGVSRTPTSDAYDAMRQGRLLGQSPPRGSLTELEDLIANPDRKRGQVSSQGEQPAEPLLDGEGKAWRTDDTAPNASSISEPQSGEATCAERAGRHTRDDVSRSLGRGDWRSWGIPAAIPKPTVRRGNDGVPSRVDRSNDVAALKALGNAVVPDQIEPVFEAIAEFERTGNFLW